MARNKVDSTNTIQCESPSLQPAAEFPHGEIDKSETSVTAPEKAVAEFVKHRSASAYEGVLSTVAASRGIEAFKDDPAKLQDWLNNMVRVKALSKTEASEGLDGQKKSNSNLTKLRKIAESSSVLTDPKVMSLLPSGSYTVMYECYRLHKVLADLNPESAVAELVKILEGHDGPLTRAWLEKQREKLKPQKAENAEDVIAQAGQAKYEVLSYQFYAINYNGDTWEGIAIPKPGKRLTLGQFLVYAISKGAQLGQIIPKTVVLVSHYDRADLPAFDDWDQLVRKTQNVRNSLVSPNVPLVAEIQFSEEKDDSEKIAVG
ncbi:hypothetical protein ACVWZK_000987 [Bradyrhizobium sp. GM0.4]